MSQLALHNESILNAAINIQSAKLDILSRLSKLVTWRDIAEIIQKEFSITHQALNQFWNYWTKNVQNEFISRGNDRISVVKKHGDSAKKKSISVEFRDKKAKIQQIGELY